jgi:D-tyrosyl-tRNA(Tyr) deacylase
MKLLLQRVSEARVTVGTEVVGEIGPGLLVLFCAEAGDVAAQAEAFARKVAKLRIFADEAGKMNRSVRQAGGAVLVVSQFTLCADTRRGNRPGFSGAAPPERAQALCELFAATLAAEGLAVSTGRFGAEMAVRLTNDGPVTIWLDSETN